MGQKENPQFLDFHTAMSDFLKIDDNLFKKGLDFGRKTVMDVEEIEKFCEEYNSKITEPESNNTK